MSERMNALAQQILGKTSVEQCELQDIKDLVNRFPYFAPGQFLLLEKLRLEQSPEYNAQLQKAVLMYHNPLEFEYFISTDKFNTEPDFPETDVQAAPEAFHAPEEIPLEEKEPEVEKEIYEEPSLEKTEELVPSAELLESFTSEVDDDLQAGSFNQMNEGYSVGKTGIADTSYQPEMLPSEETDRVPEEKVEDVNAGDEPFETGILQEETAEMKKEEMPSPAFTPERSESPISFEPFHTVDYFASQGIRLSQEEIPKDKFGRQLKSFTEWLRTMKRLPATEITAAVDPSTESRVVHLAEDSIHDPNIVTEAMAEVWLKQGNRAKALEVYNKLSLQNPSKRAYFAGLIENLKRS